METDWRCYVVGKRCLLNELIRTTIERELDRSCRLVDTLDPVIDQETAEHDASVLLLVDHSSNELTESVLELAPTFVRECSDGEAHDRERFVAALHNVEVNHASVVQAVRRGVKGIFFTTESMQTVLEGIKTLLAGDVWIPRSILVDAATSRAPNPEDLVVLESHLTMREIEILAFVSTGATNGRIADDLYISPHTVKTHLYNIYQKIGVENRLHAAMWAESNLSGRFFDLRRRHLTRITA